MPAIPKIKGKIMDVMQKERDQESLFRESKLKGKELQRKYKEISDSIATSIVEILEMIDGCIDHVLKLMYPDTDLEEFPEILQRFKETREEFHFETFLRTEDPESEDFVHAQFLERGTSYKLFPDESRIQERVLFPVPAEHMALSRLKSDLDLLMQAKKNPDKRNNLLIGLVHNRDTLFDAFYNKGAPKVDM